MKKRLFSLALASVMALSWQDAAVQRKQPTEQRQRQKQSRQQQTLLPRLRIPPRRRRQKQRAKPRQRLFQKAPEEH